MNKRPLLTLKNKSGITKTQTSPVVSSSVVVTRKRRYEVTPQHKEKPVVVSEKPQSAPAKKPLKVKAPKPAPEPVIPREIRVAETLAALQAAWPKLFYSNQVVLWEIGIRKKMWRALEKKHSRTRICFALEKWQKDHPTYFELLKVPGTPRYGLDGEPSMVVTEDQAQRAKESYS